MQDPSSYFMSDQDFEQLQGFSEELVNHVYDITVTVFRLDVETTDTTFRGEATEQGKSYKSVEDIPSVVEIQDPSVDTGRSPGDVTRTASFGFRRPELKDREFYPQSGDIVHYDDQFFEIDNVADNEMLAGKYFYRNSIVCEAHQVRESNIDLL